jgi:hypothetical protein
MPLTLDPMNWKPSGFDLGLDREAGAVRLGDGTDGYNGSKEQGHVSAVPLI